MSEPPPPPPQSVWPPDKPPALWREAAQDLGDSGVDEPVGLGGWLILVSISFVIGVPSLTYHLWYKWHLFFAPSGAWKRLTTSGSLADRSLWALVMVYETVGNAVELVWCVALLVLFLGRRRLFKPWMIAFQLASTAYLWLDHVLAIQVTPAMPGHVASLIGRTIGASLWTWYLLASRRVENTFVR